MWTQEWYGGGTGSGVGVDTGSGVVVDTGSGVGEVLMYTGLSSMQLCVIRCPTPTPPLFVAVTVAVSLFCASCQYRS